MRKTKEKTYKAALIILFVAVIICGLLIQGGQALEKTSLSPDFYRRLLNDPEVYDHIWSQLWQGITGLEEPPADSLVFSAFQHAFDEEWLKEQLGRFAGTVLDFIKGDSRQLILELDIGERKKLFQRELLRLAGETESSPLAASLESFLQERVIPARPIIISLAGAEDLGAPLADRLASLQKYRLYYQYVPYLVYGLLLLLALFLADPGTGLKWFGGGILVSGVIFAIVVPLLLKAEFVQALLQRPALLAVIFAAYPGLHVKFLELVQATLLPGALLQAGAGLVIGGVGAVVSRFNKNLGAVNPR